jgi:DNA invertase Pin-like site-specific DNA recombinase
MEQPFKKLRAATPNTPLRAAEYVRMSTDHQQYSPENQRDEFRRFADKFGMTICRTYTDGGKSGLQIHGREALQQLIRDVQGGQADFDVILVYDVSRWGRFQDPDAAAHYEFICKSAGIPVVYCAEPFENDDSLISTLWKNMKRAMSGEYSRDLSVKVFAGQCRLIRLGFRQGGPAGFGLRRMLLDQSGAAKAQLKRGEHKSLQTDRVILVPGPPEECAAVRMMYVQFVEEGKSEQQIADSLNLRGIQTDLARPWTRGAVHQVLTNQKYIGDNIFNRRSFKLKAQRVRNPPEQWVRKAGAFEAIVESDVFLKAQEIIQARSHHLSDDEMLALLKRLWEQEGELSGLLIDETEGVPSSSAYRSRFQSLLRAYHLIGYSPERDYRYIEINRQLRMVHRQTVEMVVRKLQELGAEVVCDPPTGLLSINGEFTASIIIARCRQSKTTGRLRWWIHLDTGLRPDVTIAVRMTADHQTALDYYLLPSIDLNSARLRLAEHNPLNLDAYRFDTLGFFFRMAERVRLEAA